MKYIELYGQVLELKHEVKQLKRQLNEKNTKSKTISNTKRNSNVK